MSAHPVAVPNKHNLARSGDRRGRRRSGRLARQLRFALGCSTTGRWGCPACSADEILLDRFARGIIGRKVRLLVDRAGFTRQDRHDLEQELVLRLLQSLDLFDPERAHPHVFITTVVERAVAMILRQRRAKKRQGVVRSLDALPTGGRPTELPDCRDTGRDVERLDLASDLAAVLARLPDHLRVLAEQLKSQSLSEAARAMGVPRSTLQRRVQRLRQSFEDAGLRLYL